MREIFFRGKRTDTSEWVYGDLLNVGVDYDYAIRTYGGREHGQVNAVNEKTVGQYTGLTDKNGKKVFEGDIVKVYDNFDYVGKTLYVGKVQWDDTFLNLELKTSEKIVWQLKNLPSVLYYEVIGNVFDNPEMLEVK